MLNSFMLLGLAGLAVPVIIHLIQRQRLQRQPLATLRFLDPEDVANAFAPQPRDLLQLLLRLLLLALFVLLMARLVFGGSQPGPRTLAVLLDASLSMQRRVDDQRSLFEHHRSHILELIDGLGPDDKLSLTLVGDQIISQTGYLKDQNELRRLVQQVRVTDGGSQALVPALRGAVQQLHGRCEVNACVLVFSDLQLNNFLPHLDEAGRAGPDNPTLAFRADLERGAVRLVLMDDPLPPSVNLAIESARFLPEQVHVGASSRLTAVVHNHSDKDQTATLRFHEGEQAGQQRTLSVPAGESVHVDLVHRFDAPVDSACRVELEPDAFPGDDRFHLPMRIRDRSQVLLVVPAGERDSDDKSLEIGHRGVDLLAYALNPGEMLGAGAGTQISVKRVSPPRLARVSLPIYSAIILYGVTNLPDQSARDLEAFVRNGGGLWLIPEADVSPLRFNDAFAPLLNGLAIGQLRQPEQVQPLRRTEADLSHPLFLPLLREEWGNLQEIHFSRYQAVQSPGKAEVALRTAGGDPLAAVVRLERGRVVVQLFPPDLESSSLPRTAAFVPLVQQTLAFLTSRGERPRPDTIRVGEQLRLDLPEFRNFKGDIQVKGPEQRAFPLDPQEPGTARVEGLLQAGAYEIKHPLRTGSRPRWLTVNPVAAESDQAILSSEDQEILFGSRNVARIPYAQLGEQFSHSHELTAWLLGLVFLAFAAEALFGAWQARRQAPGKEGNR